VLTIAHFDSPPPHRDAPPRRRADHPV